MKKVYILFFIAIVIVTSCKKGNVTAAIPVPPPDVSYIINDSIRLSEFSKNNYPETYNIYNNKTFYRETSKVEANYKVEGSDIIISFVDTSVLNLGTQLFLKIADKNLSSITGNFSALTSNIFYKWHQTLSTNSTVFSVDWAKADSCSLKLNYDAGTKTLSGSLTNLKYPFGIYVPYYAAGSTVTPRTFDYNLLKEGGSFREHNIRFQYVSSL